MLAGVLAIVAGALVAPSLAQAATHLNIITVVPSTRSGDVFQVQVEALEGKFRDTAFSGTITLEAAAVGGSDFALPPSLNAENGLATFNVSLNNAADGYAITASARGPEADTSNSFNVTARSLVVTNTIANVRSGELFIVGVESRDGNNDVAENFNGAVSLTADAPGSGDSGFASAVSAGASSGSVIFFNLALRNAANGYVVTATSAGLTSGHSNSFNVTATHLEVLGIGEVRAGDGFTATAEARDIDNRVAENFSGSVTISAAAVGGSNFANAAVSNTQNATAGVATFAGRVLNNAANNYAVSAASAGVTGDTSNSFNVTARSLVVTNALANVQSGQTFAVNVEARDGDNNVAENFNGAVSLTADAPGSGDSGFASAVSAGASSGSVIFSNVTLRNAASGYVVSASSTAGVTDPNAAISNAFNVTATHLVMLTTGNVRAGDAFALTVEGRDIDNRVAENFSGSVSISASAVGGSNFASAPAPQGAAAGVTTFGSLVLNNAANSYTAFATSAGLAGDASNAFDVTARSLVVTTPVANVRAGDPFTVSLEARDGNNNVAENFNSTVSLAADAPGSGDSSFASTPSQGAVNGTATFPGLALRNAADGYSITATSTAGSTSPNPGTSNAFNVTAQALVIAALANVRAGDLFGVTVTARDAQATPQIAENFTGAVSLALNVPAGGSGFAAAPAAKAATAGTASFGNLQLLNAADGYTATASSSGLPSGVSNGFDATARTLVMGTLANVRAGDPLGVAVQARDAQPVPQLAENFDETVSLTANAPAGGSGFASSPAQSASAGTVVFGSSLPNAANGYTVTTTSPGLVSATSNAFNVTARTLEMGALPGRRTGDTFAITVTARDAQATPQVAENFTGSVSLALNVPAGGSSFEGGAPAPQSPPGGTATVTFGGLRLLNAANGYSVTASSSGLAGTSNPFAATALTLRILTPVGNTRAGDAFDVTVQAFDAQATPQVAENFDAPVSLVANHTSDGSGFASPVLQSASAGTAVFAGLQLLDAANGYSFEASGGGLAASPTPPFAVTARSLVIAPFGNMRSGDAFAVSVSAMDAQAIPRVAENFAGAVGLGLDVPPGGATFAVAPAPKAASNGVVTFDGLAVLNAANGYELDASASGLVAASRSFDVGASRLVFATPSSNKVAGQPFSVQLHARDAQNNLAENFAGAVQVSAAAPGGGGNFAAGATTANASGGVVTFSGLRLDTAAKGYSLSAAAGELAAASEPFDVVAGAVSRSLTLKLSGRLVASGVLRAGLDTRCRSGMVVRIQRKTSRGWVTVGSATTDGAGAYRKRIGTRRGTYRAVTAAATLPSPTTVCRAATSPSRVSR